MYSYFIVFQNLSIQIFLDKPSATLRDVERSFARPLPSMLTFMSGYSAHAASHSLQVNCEPWSENEVSKLETPQDFMLYLLKNSREMKEIPKEFIGKGFDKLLETCKFANMTEEEQMTYVRRMKAEWDRENQLKYAESRGEARGEARGMAKGMAKGEAKGIEKTARAMKTRGMEVSVIADITGLTPEQIESL